jgi:branched-subunit amino acid transport protein AzlD
MLFLELLCRSGKQVHFLLLAILTCSCITLLLPLLSYLCTKNRKYRSHSKIGAVSPTLPYLIPCERNTLTIYCLFTDSYTSRWYGPTKPLEGVNLHCSRAYTLLFHQLGGPFYLWKVKQSHYMRIRS